MLQLCLPFLSLCFITHSVAESLTLALHNNVSLDASDILISTAVRAMDMAYQFVLPTTVLPGAYQVCGENILCVYSMTEAFTSPFLPLPFQL